MRPRSQRWQVRVLTLLLLCAGAGSRAAAEPLPDDSIYHLQGLWQDQNGAPLSLDDLAGRPRLLSFVYTYCEHTCPTIVARLQEIVAALSGAPEGLQVTLVSLDPERDTPDRMKAWMTQRGLPPEQWRMLHGTPDDVLGLAAMVGVRYRPMGERDIAHSNMITVLDRDGVIRYQSKGLGDDPADAVEALQALTGVH